MACKTIHEQDVFDTYRSAYKIKLDYSKFMDGKTLMNSGARRYKINVQTKRFDSKSTCWRVDLLACQYVGQSTI